MLATRMRQAAAGVDAAATATVAFTGKGGDATNGTSQSITVACGAGGDMVCAVYGHNGGGTISSWTLGGQTVTIRTGEVVGASESVLAIGTATGVGSGNQTMAVTWSASQLRAIGFAWRVTNVNLTTPLQTPSNTTGFPVTFSAFTSGSIVVVAAGTGASSGFTGATNITFDGNQTTEASMGGGSDLSDDTGGTTITLTGASSSQPVAAGLELDVA